MAQTELSKAYAKFFKYKSLALGNRQRMPDIKQFRPDALPMSYYPTVSNPSTDAPKLPVINNFECGFPYDEMWIMAVSSNGNSYPQVIKDKAVSKVRQGIVTGQVTREFAMYSLRMAGQYEREISAHLIRFLKRTKKQQTKHLAAHSTFNHSSPEYKHYPKL